MVSPMSTVDAELLRPASLADEIAYRLERDILEGRIGLGQRLAQDELCARFGVSRTPVREALTKLEASSLVTLRPNRGAIVRTPARREVQEVYELRAELEGFAAERACSRIDGLGVRRLGAAQHELAAAVHDVDPAAVGAAGRSELAAIVGRANDAFHDLILAAADSQALADDVRRLRDWFPKDYVTEAASSVNELLTLNVHEHEAIEAALAAGDGAGARRAMTDHIAHAGHLLIEHLDRQRFWG
jgi:DNA-binding GntR family transcriptional regulator